MIQPFIWRSKSPSVPCLAPAPCTSSPSKHEGQRELSSIKAQGPAYQGRVGFFFLCVSIHRMADLVPRLVCMCVCGRGCYTIKINCGWKHTTNKQGIKSLPFSLRCTHIHKHTHTILYQAHVWTGLGIHKLVGSIFESQKHCTKQLYEEQGAIYL